MNVSTYDNYINKIERVFLFGRYIKYKYAHEFIEGLEEVYSEIMELKTDHPDDKVNLIEAFMVGGLSKGDDIAVINKQASISNKIEFYIKFNELNLLAAFVTNSKDEELEDIGHYLGEQIGESLRNEFPLLAARVYRAQGMRIVNNKKSKYYEESVDYLYVAKQLYQANGRGEEWDKTVNTIMVEHKHKSGFMALFERIMQDKPPKKIPTFKERVQVILNEKK